MDTPCTIALIVNVIWFGLAFHLFALRPRGAVKMLTPASSRQETSREALVASLPFLGGMNLGMAVLSAAQLAERWHAAPSSVSRGPLWPLLLASATAHASQFACNVPLALRGGRRGGAPWDVLRGRMAFIFVVDGLCALLNAAVALRSIV